MPNERGRGRGGRGRGARSRPYEPQGGGRTDAQRAVAYANSKKMAWAKYFTVEKEKTELCLKLSRLEKVLDETTKSNEWNVPPHFVEEYKNLIKENKEDCECAICFEPLVTQTLFFTPKCMHKFHKECIERQDYENSEEKTKKCAICRGVFVFNK